MERGLAADDFSFMIGVEWSIEPSGKPKHGGGTAGARSAAVGKIKGQSRCADGVDAEYPCLRKTR